ncbi:MAG: hypothetical protein NVSMB2_14380 [Chloroflexota bacterium]
MLEISLLPSIAPSPATSVAPSGLGTPSADAQPDNGAGPSFLHQLRTALHGANAHHARAKRAAEPKSDAQAADDAAHAQAQPQDGKSEPADGGASDTLPGSLSDTQSVVLTGVGVPAPSQAVMPAIAPLPAVQNAAFGTAPAQGLALSGSQTGPGLLSAATPGTQPLAASVFSAATSTSNTAATAAVTGAAQTPTEPAARIAPGQAGASADAQQTAPAPAGAASQPAAAAVTGDILTPAAASRQPTTVSDDGTLPQRAAQIDTPAPPSTTPPTAEATPPGGPAGPAVLNASATRTTSGDVRDASGTTARASERSTQGRGAHVATPAVQASEPASAQITMAASPTNSNPQAASDQRPGSDSGLSATPSDDASAASATTPTANVTFASHLTNAQSASPLAGPPEQSTQATEVATQIAHQADLYRLPGGKGVRIQLHPDELGGVDVTLRYSAAEGVQLHINVEHAATGQLVQAGWTDLRDALAAQGITSDRLVMSVTAPTGGSGLDSSFNGRDGGRAGAELAGFSQGQSGQRQPPSRDDGAGATRTWFSDVDPTASNSDDGARAPVAASSHIDYRV